MSLEYGILDKKPLVDYKVKNTSIQMYDLLEKTFDDELNWDSNYQCIKITKEYVARPDLVSYALYKNDKYADILCKINGISNPFELNEGMILICPDINFIHRFSKAQYSNLDGFCEDTDTLKKKYKSFKKLKNEKRSPNEATVYDHNYIEVPDTNLLIY